jgi:hypothetical protein
VSEWLSIVKDSVTTLAAVVALYIAWQGLTTWRRQLGGQQSHDLARRLLVGVYQERNALRSVRNPVMFPSEMPMPPPEQAAQLNDRQIRFFGRREAYLARWKRVTEAGEALEVDMLEAEALWGKEFSEVYERLNGLIAELMVAVRHDLTLHNPDVEQDQKDAILRLREGRRDVIYDISEGDEATDPFSDDLNHIVGVIEGYLKPKLIGARAAG